jgi:hypothetical protein
MELEKLLKVFDAAAANLAKAEAVWDRAKPLLPNSAVLGNPQGFDDLARAWTDLIAGLPPIEDWTITDTLPTPDDIGRAFLDCMDGDHPPWFIYEDIEKPDKDIEQYRYRLNRARRTAVRTRIEVLVSEVDRLLPLAVCDVARDSRDQLGNPETLLIGQHIAEIDRLLADTCPRVGRWSFLYRHMSFTEGHDWWDIAEFDWPSVKPEILSATIAESDPLPVPDIDLGVAARSEPTGGVTTALRWDSLNDEGFERLLFHLLLGLDGYENVQLLTKTNAPDHGRDLSAYRTLNDPSGFTRRERIIVQAKHWRSKSVDSASILDSLSRLSAWEPPHIHCLVVATSGRFTPDAVRFMEAHNEKGVDPRIEPWPESHLEVMLSRRPELTADLGLRG